METIASDSGYCPLELGEAMEKIVVDGNRRKYVQLGRSLRFYGGTTSATEVGCNLRCKFCFSDKPVWKPASTGRFYSPQQVFDGLVKNARRNRHQTISASASEGTLGRQHLFELLDLVEKRKGAIDLQLPHGLPEHRWRQSRPGMYSSIRMVLPWSYIGRR